MSCCDNVLLEFKNKSTEIWTATLITDMASGGRFVGFDVGDSMGPGEKLVASVSSATNGDSQGGVGFTSAGDYKLNISYFFRADNDLGACPCKPVILFNPITAGKDFIAKAEYAEGEKEGEAWIKWTIENVPS